jgi:hypothetical protein
VFFGIRFAMLVEVSRLEKPHFYDETMRSGILRQFAHQYRFKSLSPNRTVIRDELNISSWFSLLGTIWDRFLLGNMMLRLVENRLKKLKEMAESVDWENYLKGS